MIDKQTLEEYYKKQSHLLKTLAHPVRLEILDILREDEACVCHLVAVLGQRQAYISQQLATLREAGVIRDRKDGWNVYYQINNPTIYEIMDTLCEIVSPNTELDRNALRPKNCPCPKCNPAQDQSS